MSFLSRCFICLIRLIRLIRLSALCLSGSWAQAETVTVGGITFSDERGAFTIVSLSGSGSPRDPFVFIERIHDMAGSVLVIRGLGPRFGDSAGTHHGTGFVLEKTVINATHRAWRRFDMELQEELGRPSDYLNGLSFAQASALGRPFGSDRLGTVNEIVEPKDLVRFRGGAIRPGESASFRTVITYSGLAAPEFFLIQRPDPSAGTASRPQPGRRRPPNQLPAAKASKTLAPRPSAMSIGPL